MRRIAYKIYTLRDWQVAMKPNNDKMRTRRYFEFIKTIKVN